MTHAFDAATGSLTLTRSELKLAVRTARDIRASHLRRMAELVRTQPGIWPPTEVQSELAIRLRAEASDLRRTAERDSSARLEQVWLHAALVCTRLAIRADRAACSAEIW